MAQDAAPAIRERRILLWPRGLMGRVLFVLLASIGVVFVASWTLYERAEAVIEDSDRFDLIGERLATDVRVIDGAPANTRAVLSTMLSTDDLRITWRPAVAVKELVIEPKGMVPLHERLVKANPILGHVDLRLSPGGPGRWTDISGALTLQDSSQLTFTAPDILRSHVVTQGLATAAIVTLAVLLAAAMLVHSLSLPLRALATVADTIGAGEWEPLAEKGPREVRRLAHAINAMQERISHLIEDRTEALAAVSHDLRTPLARLRLRAGFLGDGEAQEAIEADIDEMEAMVDGVLAYLSGEKEREAPRSTDLAAILTTIMDDATDRGADVVYNGPDRLPLVLPPLAMKRVFTNLVENALHYAGSASISVQETPYSVIVDVDDTGPGIPDIEIERVTTPFYRVESSRSRRTGGLGLGLAIVKREVERAGGVFVLANRPTGGLRAETILPLHSREAGPVLNS
ncbi:ATP-binding protein [Acetobacter conturbans]|uniref:histidine kinase n=1 Tax=Acetobacter conturbans TaxID=1737472 RepID=A0ABX0K6N7_9PROT|nr:ATP-binding protein [Acetobacter conturbans]NHN89079.1 HAMP domain-containing protein [Acetobacter conturbans]